MKGNAMVKKLLKNPTNMPLHTFFRRFIFHSFSCRAVGTTHTLYKTGMLNRIPGLYSIDKIVGSIIELNAIATKITTIDHKCSSMNLFIILYNKYKMIIEYIKPYPNNNCEYVESRAYDPKAHSLKFTSLLTGNSGIIPLQIPLKYRTVIDNLPVNK